MRCGQAIFTSATTKRADGYQMIAWSKSVENDIEEIKKYSIHRGLIPSRFDFQSSYYVHRLSNGDFCIGKRINAGKDSEGRSNRIYSHSIIMNDDQFKQIRGDISFLEKYFGFNDSVRDIIDEIEISIPTSQEHSINEMFSIATDTNYFKDIKHIFNAIPSNKQILIIINDSIDQLAFASFLLIILPHNIQKLCSISTFVSTPDQEPFKIMFIPSSIKNYMSLEDKSNYCIISLDNHKHEHTSKQYYGYFIEEHIKKESYESILDFNVFFDTIQNGLSTIDIYCKYWNKIIQSKKEEYLSERMKLELDAINIIENVNVEIAIQRYYNLIELLKKSKDFENLVSVSLIFSNMLLKNKKTKELINNYKKVCNTLVKNRKHFDLLSVTESILATEKVSTIEEIFISYLEKIITTGRLKRFKIDYIYTYILRTISLLNRFDISQSILLDFKRRIVLQGIEIFIKKNRTSKIYPLIGAYMKEISNVENIENRICLYKELLNIYSNIRKDKNYMRLLREYCICLLKNNNYNESAKYLIMYVELEREMSRIDKTVIFFFEYEKEMKNIRIIDIAIKILQLEKTRRLSSKIVSYLIDKILGIIKIIKLESSEEFGEFVRIFKFLVLYRQMGKEWDKRIFKYSKSIFKIGIDKLFKWEDRFNWHLTIIEFYTSNYDKVPSDLRKSVKSYVTYLFELDDPRWGNYFYSRASKMLVDKDEKTLKMLIKLKDKCKNVKKE